MRYLNFIAVVSLLLLASCSSADQKLQQLESKNGFAVMVPAVGNEKLATFAGGCFWSTQEAMMELRGVHKVISGYAGGTKPNPTYQDLQSQTTGYAEAVQVYYDPAVISFETLCKAFFHAHDPTQVNGQGPDIGPEYRSIAFFRSPEEYRTLSALIHKLERTDFKGQKIATELIPFEVIYPAETEHQDYYQRNLGNSYIKNVCGPKVMKLRAKMPEIIKSDYLK